MVDVDPVNYIFFYTPKPRIEGCKACLSNWYTSVFSSDGIKFENVEKWIMYEKAKLFKDHITALDILNETTPNIIPTKVRITHSIELLLVYPKY